MKDEEIRVGQRVWWNDGESYRRGEVIGLRVETSEAWITFDGERVILLPISRLKSEVLSEVLKALQTGPERVPKKSDVDLSKLSGVVSAMQDMVPSALRDREDVRKPFALAKALAVLARHTQQDGDALREVTACADCPFYRDHTCGLDSRVDTPGGLAPIPETCPLREAPRIVALR